jgi:hypothetical protein
MVLGKLTIKRSTTEPVTNATMRLKPTKTVNSRLHAAALMKNSRVNGIP